MQEDDLEYAGFRVRLLACLIDGFLLLLVTVPLLLFLYGPRYVVSDKKVEGPADFLISFVFPFAATIWFWMNKLGTPGKLLLSLRVVDAETGSALTLPQSVLRYLGYIVSTIPFFLGFFWVIFDGRKRGFHDKIANSVVVRGKDRRPQKVQFPARTRGVHLGSETLDTSGLDRKGP